MKEFPHEKGLQTRTAVLVPSTKHGNVPVSKREFSRRISETRDFLTKEFGGTTITRGYGTYIGQSGRVKGKVIGENVAIIENFSSGKDWKKHRKEVEDFVESHQQKWGQESIGFEIQSPRRPLSLIFAHAHDKRKMKAIS